MCHLFLVLCITFSVTHVRDHDLARRDTVRGMRICQVEPISDVFPGNNFTDRQLDWVDGVHDVDITGLQDWNDEITSLDGWVRAADTAVPAKMMDFIVEILGVESVEDGTVCGRRWIGVNGGDVVADCLSVFWGLKAQNIENLLGRIIHGFQRSLSGSYAAA